jgi:hypothetical protein
MRGKRLEIYRNSAPKCLRNVRRLCLSRITYLLWPATPGANGYDQFSCDSDSPKFDAFAGVLAGHTFEVLDERILSIGDDRVVLRVIGADVPPNGFGRLAFVEHQVVENASTVARRMAAEQQRSGIVVRVRHRKSVTRWRRTLAYRTFPIEGASGVLKEPPVMLGTNERAH